MGVERPIQLYIYKAVDSRWRYHDRYRSTHWLSLRKVEAKPCGSSLNPKFSLQFPETPEPPVDPDPDLGLQGSLAYQIIVHTFSLSPCSFQYIRLVRGTCRKQPDAEVEMPMEAISTASNPYTAAQLLASR